LTADPLEDLATSIERPLRFYREADERQRGRIHLPVRAWAQRVGAARDQEALESDARRALDEIAAALEAVAAVDEAAIASRGDLVDALLSRVERLRGVITATFGATGRGDTRAARLPWPRGRGERLPGRG
jgi:hypothetical protein